MVRSAPRKVSNSAGFRRGLTLWLDRRGIWLVVAIAAACYALSFNPRLSGTDDATYLVAAQALADGRGFCKANLEGCPPETYYPPGFPLVLAPFVAVLPGWPHNVALLMFIPLAFALLSLPLAHQFLKRQVGIFPLALLIAVALAVSYVGTWFTFVLMTETLYILLSMAGMLLLDRAERSTRSYEYYALAGAIISFVAIVRSVGLTLLAATVGYLLLRKRWRAALIVLSFAAIVVLPVTVRSYLSTRSPAWAPYRGVFINSYLDTFFQKHWQDTTLGRASLTDLAQRWLGNLRGHATDSLPRLLFPTLQSPRLQRYLEPLYVQWVIPVFGWAMAGAVVAGFSLRVRQGLRFVDLYVLLYTGLVLLPGWYTYRNLLPILAFIYLYIVLFLRAIAGTIAGMVRQRHLSAGLGLALPISFLLLSVASNSLSMIGTNFEMGALYRASSLPYVEDPSFFEACGWIHSHTQPGELVVYGSSEKMFLCSGRQAPPALSTMPVSLGARAHDSVVRAVYHEADFVVVTMSDVLDPPLTDSEPVDYQSTAFLHPVLEQDAETFALRYETAQTPTIRIYQVLRAGRVAP